MGVDKDVSTYMHEALFTYKYTLYGIRYTLYDLLSATGNIQVM